MPRYAPITSTGFSCPYCHAAKTEVRDSRPTDKGRVRRRRVCPNCGSKFSTLEILADDLPSVDLSNPRLKARTSLNLFIRDFNELAAAVKEATNRAREPEV